MGSRQVAIPSSHVAMPRQGSRYLGAMKIWKARLACLDWACADAQAWSWAPTGRQHLKPCQRRAPVVGRDLARPACQQGPRGVVTRRWPRMMVAWLLSSWARPKSAPATSYVSKQVAWTCLNLWYSVGLVHVCGCVFWEFRDLYNTLWYIYASVQHRGC
jgi:hypothetical protein